jgi:hypothetical protein
MRATLLFGAIFVAVVGVACDDDDPTPRDTGTDVTVDLEGDADAQPDVVADADADVAADVVADADVTPDVVADPDLAEDPGVEVGNDGTDVADTGGEPTELVTVLTGGQEAPEQVVTDAFGTGVFVLSADHGEIAFTLTIADIEDVTDAHIHFGALGIAGPVLFPLPGATTFTSPLTGTLTVANFTPAVAVGIGTYEEAIAAILAGDTYVNVHTTAYPAGEVRGQLGELTFGAVLTGAQEAPDPVETDASGFATLVLAADHSALEFTVTVADIADVTDAHIHVGGLGTAGSVLFPLPGATTFVSPLTGTLTAADFTAAVAEEVGTYEEAIGLLLEGHTYFNVHTTDNPAGEVRGQIGAVRLSASLDGDQEAPDPVVTDATGEGTVTLSADQTTLTYTLEVTGITSAVTGAHIHLGVRGVAGPILFGLPNGTDLATDEIRGTLDVDDLMVLAGEGIETMRDAVNAILIGDTYFNVHTGDEPAGEIRGQIEP